MDDVLKTFEGEFYLHSSGKVHKRKPAGGSGGGVTGYADEEASEAEAVAYFDLMKERQAAEAEALTDRHEEAKTVLAEHREAEAKESAKETAKEEAAAPTATEQRAEINAEAAAHKAPAEPVSFATS